jgi:Bacterial PH domain
LTVARAQASAGPGAVGDAIIIGMKEKTEDQPDQKPRRLSLRSDEAVVLVATPSRLLSLPKYLITLGLYGFWRKRQNYVLTDQRVLMGRGIFNRTERSIPLNRIEDASFMRKGAGAYCEVVIQSHGRRRTDMVGPLSARNARRFTAEIQART